LNILIDAFGGDNAPLEVIRGGAQAVQELGVTVTLVGDEQKIRDCAEENGLPLDGMEILHAPAVFDIHEEPTSLLKQHADTSMAVGMQALHDGKGDAFVCAGSTGALLVGATFLVKRIPGIKRAAVAPVLPTETTPFLLIDGGANNDCRPEMLVQFAIMGSAYMQNVMQVEKPRVALLNVGAEETKGRELELESYVQLSQAPVNFIGNIEARAACRRSGCGRHRRLYRKCGAEAVRGHGQVYGTPDEGQPVRRRCRKAGGAADPAEDQGAHQEDGL
jgi:glycerol-3-phosphate acyltransferase PlsX